MATPPPLGPRYPLRQKVRCLTDEQIMSVLATKKWLEGQTVTPWLEQTVQEEQIRRAKVRTFGLYIDF